MKGKFWRVLLVLALLFSMGLVAAGSIAAEGATLYVSTAGTDVEACGTEASPCRTIQYTINKASAGDTINVAAGTYTEQILIQKPLALVGAGKGSTIIQAPGTRSGTVSQGSTWDYIVAAYPTSGTIAIRIQGFTIDANNQPKTAGTAGLIGVFFRDVKGEQAGSYSCAIQGFEQVEYQSWGIRVYGDSALSIEDNTLTGYTRDGISVNGDGAAEADPVVTINNNDLTGSALPLNGISVGDGATGTISGNTVRDHTRSAEWGAVGIIVDNSDNVQVTDNTISNCFYGIYLGDADFCSISGNTLTDNIRRAISLDTASNNTVSSNIINGPAAGTDDTAIGLDNNCTNNTIGGGSLADGNTITMATSGTGNLYAIYMQASVGASANLISNNTITGGARAVQFDGPPGITGITTISNNVISGQSFGGIVANNNGSLVITGNSLTDTTRPMEFWGPVDVTITGNIIDGAAYDGINLGNVSGVKNISGNTIRNCPGNYSAIHGQPDADNLVIDNNIISTSYTGIRIENGCTGVSIINNIISNNSFSGISTYDALLTVTGNTIDQSYRGIETNADLTAHNNAFTNNEYGSVLFYADGIRDITNNWWGSVSGPAAYLRDVNINTFNQGLQGDYIQANNYASFTFTPWLDAASPAGVSFAPVTNGADGYASIQSAIDAASAGDTINVAAGTYNELVTINTANLTLKAEAPGQATIKPSAERVAWPYGAVLITQDGVTVDGFEVNGTNGLNNGINAYGVSGVTIKNNLIHGTTAAWEGVGIIVWDWDATKTVDNATIANNTVYDTGRMGILVMDYGVSGYDVTEGHVISGNIVHDTWQKGVDWSDGGGSIQINAGKNCSITDNEVYNTQNDNWGIYMFGSASGNQITNNTIRDNPIGLGLWISSLPDGETINWGSDAAASPGIHFNNIYSNTTFGAASYGDQAADRIDATNNWWGTSVGTEIAAMVSGNVDYDPWIGAAAEEVASDTLSDGEVVALPSSEVTATLSSSGTAAVTLAKYADNPVEAEGGVIGSGTAFYDVQVTGSTDAAATLSVVLSGATPGDVAWYYAGSAWRPVKDNDGATPLADADGLLTIVFGPDSTPKLSELTGTPIVADGEALAVQFASDTAIVGQAITAQVVAKSTNLHGVEVQLTFDASKLEVKSLVLGGDLLAQQVDQNTYDNAAGTITFAYSQASLTPVQVGDDILLATITFTPKATAASTAVGLNTATLSDPDGVPLGVYPTTLEYVDTNASIAIGNMIAYLTLVF
ncbi:MAG: right-handed parallel beta-helix repeat-containing protein [Chloroflexi bacterium]|nr:right-handed parallel beta-helix repeat-containing protein [Chloroflexota bacterium]